jgi:mannose-6-phosphate isomerase-like protein (cupin superfamily)
MIRLGGGAGRTGAGRPGVTAAPGNPGKERQMEKVNLADKFARIRDPWAPKAVGAVNDFQVKIVKIRGEFVWHSHDVEDELFLVLKGRLRLQLRDREITVDPGEFIIVPHGTDHRPVADEETHLLVLEPATTVNTGTAGGDRTRDVEWI